MRLIAVSLAALMLMALPAWAQQTPSTTTVDPTIDIQLFHPAPGGNNFIVTESGDVNSSLAYSVGLDVNYARNPLAIHVIKAGGEEESIGLVVKNRIDTNLLFALGLFDIADIGLVMPLVYQGGFDDAKFQDANITSFSEAPKSFTQGDLRVIPKIRFLHLSDGLLSAAIVGTVVIPSASGAAYAGEAGPVVMPSLAISTRTDVVRAAINGGYALRNKAVELGSITIDDEVFASLAVALNLSMGQGTPIEVVGEVFGRTPADNAFGMKSSGSDKDFEKARTTLEGDLGIRLTLADNFIVSFGGGGGMLPGYGAPAPRVFAGLTYYSGEAGIADADQDGVPDDSDQCPDRKEDKDGFEDDNGCPDLDNDKDNVADEDDQCPNEPEDKDGYKDDDGCPDPDNDEDGVLDGSDKCPVDNKEDKDGFEDEDGCADLDNDKDGIADAVDKCPNQPEDVDNFQDADGCPDPDNDGDGLNDLGDMCPNNAEDKDGVADDDGCPEDNDGDGIPDELDKCPNEAEVYNGIDDEDGCPEKLQVKSLVEVTAEKIEIKDKIFFKTGSAEIMSKSFGLLDQVASVLRNYKHITKVRIEGHTDATGNRKQNVKLSKDRAESVRKYLIQKGIDAARLDAEGFGPDKPIASNKTAKGKEMNRRVEFVIVEQKPIGKDVSEQAAPPPPPPAATQPATDGGAPATAPATPPPAGDQPLFQMDIGGEEAQPDDKADKGKGKKKGKAKKKKKDEGVGSEPAIEFNF